MPDTPILEADAPVKFARELRRHEHVVKHILMGRREENWARILPNALIMDALSEYRSGKNGDACRALGDLYENYLADRLVERCREHREHAHWHTLTDDTDWLLLTERRNEPTENELRGQSIEAWSVEDRLFLAAKCFRVRKDEWTPYILVTGYRTHPELSPERFKRKMAETLSEKRRVRPMGQRVAAWHDRQEGEA